MVEINDITTQDQALHTIRGANCKENRAFDSTSLIQAHDGILNKTKSLESLLAKKKKKKNKFRINQSEFAHAPTGNLESGSPTQRKLLSSSSVEWNRDFFLQDIKQARENETAQEVSPCTCNWKQHYWQRRLCEVCVIHTSVHQCYHHKS